MAFLAKAATHFILLLACIAIGSSSFGASLLLQPQQIVKTPARFSREATPCYRPTRQPQHLILQASPNREDDIRRKIAKLKREGKIDNEPSVPQDDGKGTSATPVSKQYGSKLAQKLGRKKAKRLGLIGEDDAELDRINAELDAEEEEPETSPRRQAQLGSLPKDEDEDAEEQGDQDGEMSNYFAPESSSSTSENEMKNFNSDIFGDEDDEADEEQMSEEELLEFVAAKLAEKRRIKEEQEEERRVAAARKRIEELQNERKEREAPVPASEGTKTTSGIGGTWIKTNETKLESYKPKTGSWGYFERPKDISKAFGGGKRVGAGYTPDSITRQKSEESTRDRLRQYREKVGIDVQSEKDHAIEIEQALEIGRRAMERGVYSTAVSALEQVTKWCSTNSPVGGRVFLELAMAYEANGRTQEAITVYTTLTRSRMEDVKYNAKRLLYGIEAMQFMQNEARNPEFSRKKIRTTFIDTTGLANIAQNFDDVYQTAYVDLSRNIYKQLTESVVRSNREARQILLKATGAGEVERMKVVQALRSISRNFDDALEEEMKNSKPAKEPVAVMDGKPIVAAPDISEKDDLRQMMAAGLDLDVYTLASAEQMKENLNGEWRLQLLADKRGDGVKYYNTSFSWQKVDTQTMTFRSKGSSGFLTVSQSGGIEFQDSRRILTRTDLDVSGTGGPLSGFFVKGSGGAAGAVSTPHQIVAVDSVLLITRMAPMKNKRYEEAQKEYFAVWRRVDPGTFSSSS